MAREHLYKAKRKDNGEWVEGFYYTYLDYHYILVHNKNLYLRGWGNLGAPSHFDIDENTICEYTNKKDKNGVKVFEHDIIQYKHQRTGYVYKGVVVYDDDGAGYVIKDVEQGILAHMSQVCEHWEVIGNKFDNDLEVQDEQAN